MEEYLTENPNKTLTARQENTADAKLGKSHAHQSKIKRRSLAARIKRSFSVQYLLKKI